MDIDRFIIFPNLDKDKIIKKDRGVIPGGPNRFLIVGNTGSSKTTTMMNLFVLIRPYKCVVVHGDAGGTHEYDLFDDATIIDPNELEEDEEGDFPMLYEAFNGKDHGMVIVDEVPLVGIGVKKLKPYERLMNYGSTHRNITVVFIAQNLTSIPPVLRRASNQLITCGPVTDRAVAEKLIEGFGIKKEFFRDLESLKKDPTDSIWIRLRAPEDDMWKYSLNIHNPIKRVR